MSTLITVYYLAIKNIPSLLDVFPRFVPFAILATVTGVPLSVAIGWVHLKRSRLYSSEADIAIEANPYQYKLGPGKDIEVNGPTQLVYLQLLRKLAERSGLLTESEKAEIAQLEHKLVTLLKGGYVGTPRRRDSF